MDIFDAIKNRHSYRGPFADKAVPRGDLKKIVEAGLCAPSGCNAQTTTFVIVDDKEILGQITKMPEANTALQQARALIACVVDIHPKPVISDLSFQVEDCSAAVENMLLAVTGLGYATVWIDGWLKRDDRAKTVGDLLGLLEGKTVRIILPIGVPLEKGSPAEKKPFAVRAWFNRYGEDG